MPVLVKDNNFDQHERRVQLLQASKMQQCHDGGESDQCDQMLELKVAQILNLPRYKPHKFLLEKWCFSNSRKVIKYFGYFCRENFQWELPIWSQSLITILLGHQTTTLYMETITAAARGLRCLYFYLWKQP